MKELRKIIRKIISESIEMDGEYIDVSCAALASINVDGNYLLFKEKSKYQPIGGGLKYYDSALPFLESINFRTDRTDNDLRIQIPKENWEEFKKWFESGRDRETSISREIDEELTPYLGSSMVGKMQTNNYNLKEVITEKYRIFQIHKITFPDDVREAIIELVNNNEEFILATPSEMISQSNNISNHSFNIIL